MRRAAARLVASHYAHRTGDHGVHADEARSFLRRHHLAVHADALWRYDPAIRAWTIVHPATPPRHGVRPAARPTPARPPPGASTATATAPGS